MGESKAKAEALRMKKKLEGDVGDLEIALDHANAGALETRIRELESEMDAESRRLGDAQKNLRKSEGTIKELTFASDEDKKNHQRMQGLIDQMQSKIKSYKKQIEE